MNDTKPLGQTKRQGWEIGVRRTFPVGTGQLWEAVTTQPGLGYWLGTGVVVDFRKGDTYQTREGTRGEIRGYEAGSLIRLTWQPQDWDFSSTLQLRVIPTRKGSTLSIHHERLQDATQREAMRQHWTAVIDQFAAMLER